MTPTQSQASRPTCSASDTGTAAAATVRAENLHALRLLLAATTGVWAGYRYLSSAHAPAGGLDACWLDTRRYLPQYNVLLPTSMSGVALEAALTRASGSISSALSHSTLSFSNYTSASPSLSCHSSPCTRLRIPAQRYTHWTTPLSSSTSTRPHLIRQHRRRST